MNSTTYPGQFLSWVLTILTSLRRQRRTPCSEWGCVVFVGPESPWGLGPSCDLCRWHLRPAALPDPGKAEDQSCTL